MGNPDLEAASAPRPDDSEATDPAPPPLPARPPPPPYVQNAFDDVHHDHSQASSSPSSVSSSSHQIPRKAVPGKGRSPPPPHLEINTAQPLDFEGELATNNEIPSRDTLRKIEDYVVLDRDGKSHPFKSLYTGTNVARRVLVIFVRHFFCGNCQEFLRSLSEAVTPDALLRLPVSTFIAVIGCGDPKLIDMYVSETSCPFPVYTDPTRSLFQALEMTNTLALGTKPAYMRKSMTRSIMESVVQGIKQIPAGNALKSGDQRQVGGEFLFEPRDIITPVSTPREDKPQRVSAFEEPPSDPAPALGSGSGKGPAPDRRGGGGGGAGAGEEKRVTWCHRMKTTRDHAEIPELMEVLGLDPSAFVGGIRRQGSGPATSLRKGQGSSMADQIRKISAEQSRSPTI